MKSGMKLWLVTLHDSWGNNKLCWHGVIARTEKSAVNETRKELRRTFVGGGHVAFDNRFKVLRVTLVDDAEYTRLCNAVGDARRYVKQAEANLKATQAQLKSAESHCDAQLAKLAAINNIIEENSDIMWQLQVAQP